jgi:type III secretion system low calcium response chaperone LcrH/SycD
MKKKRIKISELLTTKGLEKHKEVLLPYFAKGGTWHELLQCDPKEMESSYAHAYKLYQKAAYKEAAAAFSYLTILNPYEYNFWMGLGLSKQSDSLYEEAIVSYIAAETMDEAQPYPHLFLAQCFYALHIPEQVKERLQQTIRIAGDKKEFREVKQQAADILLNLPST